jgi:hypothetical protein
MRELIEARVEDGILKEIMITNNGLPLPAKHLPKCSLATVSMVGGSGRDQHLRVDVSGNYPDPRYHPYYGLARYPTPSVDSTLDIEQLSISSHKTSRKGSSHDRKPISRASSCPHEPHPHGLDSTQAGIDFVLR